MNEVAKTDGNYQPVALGVTADVNQYVTMLRTNAAGDAILVEAVGGGGSITGASNGLSVSGTDVVLGGTLTSDTQIDGAGKGLVLTNLSDLQIDCVDAVIQATDGLEISGGEQAYMHTLSGYGFNAIESTKETRIFTDAILANSATAGDVFTLIDETTGQGEWQAVSVGGAGLTAAMCLGDGADGNVTLSSGTTTLTKPMYYRNLTLSGTAKIVTAGYPIYVLDTLDLTNATAGAINYNGTNGNNASGATGGTAISTSLASNYYGGAAASGGGGGTGTTGAGGAGGGPNTTGALALGGGTNGGGAGGAGSGGAGGAAGGTIGTTTFVLKTFQPYPLRNWVNTPGAPAIGGYLGGTGGAGGGDGVNTGRGGGGGALSAGTLAVFCNTLQRAGTTASGAIACIGGTGGNGGSGATGNVGGGGGGAGGGGGWLQVAYFQLAGSTAINIVDVSGGAGGNGSDGAGTGIGGRGGVGGTSGRYLIVDLTTGNVTESGHVAGSTATAPTNATGTTGGAGGSAKVSI